MAVNPYSNPFDVAENLSTYYEEEKEDNAQTGVFGGAVESGAHGLSSSFNNALAAGSRVLGADNFARSREQAADIAAAKAAGAGHMVPTFEEGLSNPADFAGWSTGAVGSNLPLMGTMIGAGLLGGAAGARLAGRKGLTRTAGRAAREDVMASMVEEAMKKQPKKKPVANAIDSIVGTTKRKTEAELLNRPGVKKLLDSVERSGVAAADKKTLIRNIVEQGLSGRNKLAALGSLAGGGLPYLGTTTGETYSGLRKDPDALGTPEEKARAAIASGAAQTGLGLAFQPLSILQRVGVAKAPMAAAATSMLGEGVTEASEQAIQQYTQQQFNPEAGFDPMELAEAGVAGAIVGGATALPGAAYQSMQEALAGKETTNQTTDDATTDQTISDADIVAELEKAGVDNEAAQALLGVLNARMQPQDTPNQSFDDELNLALDGVETVDDVADIETTSKTPIADTLIDAVDQGMYESYTPDAVRVAAEETGVDITNIHNPKDTIEAIRTQRDVLNGMNPVSDPRGADQTDDTPQRSLNIPLNVTDEKGRPRRDFIVDVSKDGKQVRIAPTGQRSQQVEMNIPNDLDALQKMDAFSSLEQKIADVKFARRNIPVLDKLTETAKNSGNKKLAEGLSRVRSKLSKNTGLTIEDLRHARFSNLPTPNKSHQVSIFNALADTDTATALDTELNTVNEYYNTLFDELETTSDETGTFGLLPRAKLIDEYKQANPNWTENDVQQLNDEYIAAEAEAQGTDPAEHKAMYDALDADITRRMEPFEASINALRSADELALGNKYSVAVTPPRTVGKSPRVRVSNPRGHSIELPATVNEIFTQDTVQFRGQPIDAGEIKLRIAEAVAADKPINMEDIFERAQTAYEYRTTPRRKGVSVLTRGIGGEPGTFTFEENWEDLRINPLIAEYGITPVKLLGGGDPGENLANVVEHYAEDGLVLAGKMDNQAFFAPKEQRDRLLKDYGLEETLLDDANVVERIGTILKKESGDSHIYDVSGITERHGEFVDAQGNTQQSHDGVMIIKRGMRTGQGVLTRAFYVRDPDTGQIEVRRVADKGIARSPIQANAFEVDESGHIKSLQKVAEEQESLNNELQFGKKLSEFEGAEHTVPGPRAEIAWMRPVAQERGGTANQQQVSFGLERSDAVQVFAEDTLNLTTQDLPDILTTDENNRIDLGTPAKMLLDVFRMLGKSTKIDAKSVRSYAFSTDDSILSASYAAADSAETKQNIEEAFAKIDRTYVPGIDDVMLMPRTYNQYNALWRQQQTENGVANPENLKAGDVIILSRDPALPDGSNMAPFVFRGVSTLESPQGTHGLGFVVHTLNANWKEMAGDFDGDVGNVMVPTETFFPKPTETWVRPDTGKPLTFLKKGNAKKDPVDVEAARYLDTTVPKDVRSLSARVEAFKDENGVTHTRDMLSLLAARRFTSFSQMIGTIMRPAQQLAELGMLNVPLRIPLFDETTGNIIQDAAGNDMYVDAPAFAVLSALGQGSISAKKKAAWDRIALSTLESVREQIAELAPVVTDPSTGDVLTTSEYDKELKARVTVPQRFPFFSTLFAAVKKAPETTPGADVQEHTERTWFDGYTPPQGEAAVREYYQRIEKLWKRVNTIGRELLNDSQKYPENTQYPQVLAAALSDTARHLNDRYAGVLSQRYGRGFQFDVDNPMRDDRMMEFILTNDGGTNRNGKKQGVYVPNEILKRINNITELTHNKDRAKSWRAALAQARKVIADSQLNVVNSVATLLASGQLSDEAQAAWDAFVENVSTTHPSKPNGPAEVIDTVKNDPYFNYGAYKHVLKLHSNPEINVPLNLFQTFAYRIETLNKFYDQIGLMRDVGWPKHLKDAAAARREKFNEADNPLLLSADEAREILKGRQDRVKALSRQKEDLDEIADANEIRVLQKKISEINNATKAEYLIGMLSAEDLIANGVSSAARYIRLSDLEAIAEVSDKVEQAKVSMVAYDGEGNRSNSSIAPSGVYRVDGGQLKLVRPFAESSDGTVPSVTLKINSDLLSPSIVNHYHQVLANTYKAGEDHVLAVRKTSEGKYGSGSFELAAVDYAEQQGWGKQASSSISAKAIPISNVGNALIDISNDPQTQTKINTILDRIQAAEQNGESISHSERSFRIPGKFKLNQKTRKNYKWYSNMKASRGPLYGFIKKGSERFYVRFDSVQDYADGDRAELRMTFLSKDHTEAQNIAGELASTKYTDSEIDAAREALNSAIDAYIAMDKVNANGQPVSGSVVTEKNKGLVQQKIVEASKNNRPLAGMPKPADATGVAAIKRRQSVASDNLMRLYEAYARMYRHNLRIDKAQATKSSKQGTPPTQSRQAEPRATTPQQPTPEGRRGTPDKPPKILADGVQVTRIISGGQTGADMGGLKAAHHMGIQSGGTAPKGWRTAKGSDSTLGSEYGLQEHSSESYVPRTIQNVDDADATIAFRYKPSAGTDNTIGYAQTGKWQKGEPKTTLDGHRPVLVVDSRNGAEVATQIRKFLKETSAKTINIAGHRDASVSPQPGAFEHFVTAVVSAGLQPPPVTDSSANTGPTDTGPTDTGPTDTGPTDTGPEDVDDPNLERRFITANGETRLLSVDQAKAIEAAMPMRDRKVAGENLRIIGPAGTGKTTLVRELMRRWRYVFGDGGVLLATPTKRANWVMRQMSAVKTMFGTQTETPRTLEQLMGSKRDKKGNFYYPEPESFYKQMGRKKDRIPPIGSMGPGNVVIIDEISMMDSAEINTLTEWQNLRGFNVIFLGDKKQLPPVGEKIAPIFARDIPEARLNKVMRQQGSNPLLDQLTKLRKGEDPDLSTNYNAQTGEGIIRVGDAGLVMKFISQVFTPDIAKTNMNQLRVLAGTNRQVRRWNEDLHQVMHPNATTKVAEGEVVIGYRNAKGAEGGDIDNGVEYVVHSVGPETQKTIHGETFTGNEITVANDNSTFTTFLVAPEGYEQYANWVIKNQNEIDQLVAIAKQSGDWSGVRERREQVEEYYNDVVILDDVQVRINKDGTKKADAKNAEGGATVKRLFDLAYASTIHKAQGGTVNIAVVDMNDILRNFRHDGKESENKMLYTALSRASKTAVLVEPDASNSQKELGQLTKLATEENFYTPVQDDLPVENVDDYGMGEVPYEAANSSDPRGAEQSEEEKEYANQLLEQLPGGFDLTGLPNPEFEGTNPTRRNEPFLGVDLHTEQRARMQDSVDNVSLLFGLSPIKILSASEMVELLHAIGRPGDLEAAMGIVAHAQAFSKGKRGGKKGMHIKTDKGHFIYMSQALSEEDQAVTLSHEIGHAIIEDELSNLKAADADVEPGAENDASRTYQRLVNDYRAWLTELAKSDPKRHKEITDKYGTDPEYDYAKKWTRTELPTFEDVSTAHGAVLVFLTSATTEALDRFIEVQGKHVQKVMNDPDSSEQLKSAAERDLRKAEIEKARRASMMQGGGQWVPPFHEWLADQIAAVITGTSVADRTGDTWLRRMATKLRSFLNYWIETVPKLFGIGEQFVKESTLKKRRTKFLVQSGIAQEQIDALSELSTQEFRYEAEQRRAIAEDAQRRAEVMQTSEESGAYAAAQQAQEAIAEANAMVEAAEQEERLAAMRKAPEILTSVHQWLEGMAKSDTQLTRELGVAENPNERLTDRLARRQLWLKQWADNPNEPNIEALNILAPQIRDNLPNLLSPRDVDMLRREVSSAAMKKRLTTLLSPNTEALDAVNNNSDMAVAYFYALTSTGVMQPAPPMNPVLRKLTESLRLANRTTLEATAEETNEIIRSLNLRSAAVLSAKPKPLLTPDMQAYRLYKERSQRFARGNLGKAQRALKGYNDVAGWAIDVPAKRIQRLGIPALSDASGMIQQMAYELQGLKRVGMRTKAQAQHQLFMSGVRDVMRGLSEQDVEDLKQLLYPVRGSKPTASDAAKAAEAKMRRLLKMAYDYAQVSGLEFEQRENYWPFTLDKKFIKENIDQVVEYYTADSAWTKDWDENGAHTGADEDQDGWGSVRRKYIDWIEKNADPDNPGHARGQLMALQSMTLDQFIRHYLEKDDQHTLPGWELEQLPGNRATTPGFRFSNPRLLDFLLDSRNEDIHANVLATMDTNIVSVMQRYTRNLTKRAEWQSFLETVQERWPAEEDDTNPLSGLWRAARTQGATQKDIDLMIGYIDAIHGQLGLKERDWLDTNIDRLGPNSIAQGLKSSGGEVMNKHLNSTRSWIQVWTDMAHLTLSGFTALQDPLGTLVRDGGAKRFTKQIADMAKTTKAINGQLSQEEQVRLLRRIEKSLLVGAHNAAYTVDDLIATYVGPDIDAKAQNLLVTYFKLNGVQSISDFTSSLAQGIAFLNIEENGRKAQAGDERAVRELQLLGLAPEDVVFDEFGELKVLTLWDHETASEDEKLRDVRVRSAIITFVEESQVRPNSTNRSLFMSNPYFSLLAMWRNYPVAYSNQILAPAWGRLAQDGNAVPIMALALSAVPVLLLAELLRDGVRNLGDGDGDEDWFTFERPRWKKDWEWHDHLAYAVKRSGLWGNDELVADVLGGLADGGPREALAEAGGVVASDVNKYAKWGSVPMPLGDLVKWG